MARRERDAPESEDLRSIVMALEMLKQRCPRLVRACYWAGPSSIAAEELDASAMRDLLLSWLKEANN